MPTPQVIDLSHHNTVPKYLHDAAAAGIVGVIHKATEGLSYVDPKCAARRALAQDAGLFWGIYHFLRPGNIKNQADWFLSHKNLYDANTLLALDFEDDGISADDLITWLERVEGKTGQKPVLYSGSFLKQLKGQERLGHYRLWLAQYGSRAVLPKGFTDYFLWQYSESGRIPGIEGTCDVNTSNLTNAELRQNWIDSPSASQSATQAAPTDQQDNGQTPSVNETPIPAEQPAPPKPADSPVEVKKESPSLYAKIGAALTAISGIGINVGSLIQNKLDAMTPAQLGYLVLALGLVALGVYWYIRSAKAAQQRTAQLVEKAADPKQNTVELK